MKVGDKVFRAYVSEISGEIIVEHTTLTKARKASWHLAERLWAWNYRQQVPVGCGFASEVAALEALYKDLQEAEKGAERTLRKVREWKEKVGVMLFRGPLEAAVEALTEKKP